MLLVRLLGFLLLYCITSERVNTRMSYKARRLMRKRYLKAGKGCGPLCGAGLSVGTASWISHLEIEFQRPRAWESNQWLITPTLLSPCPWGEAFEGCGLGSAVSGLSKCHGRAALLRHTAPRLSALSCTHPWKGSPLRAPAHPDPWDLLPGRQPGTLRRARLMGTMASLGCSPVPRLFLS